MSASAPGIRRALRDALILSAYRLRKLRQGTPCAGGRKRVIALHEVEAADTGTFRQRMTFLRERFDVRPLAALLRGPEGEGAQVALTFDDGYASWAEAMAPILAELRIPATFFVCSGLVGLDSEASARFYRERLRRRRPFPPFTRAHLRSLAANPLFEIGSHTVHHPDLAMLDDPAALQAEIAGDRAALEAMVGRPVRYFAWPFGSARNLSPAARAAIAGAGFEAAFTTMPGAIRKHGDSMLFGRDMLSLDEPEAVWAARLSGAYDRLYRLKESFGIAGMRLRAPKRLFQL